MHVLVGDIRVDVSHPAVLDSAQDADKHVDEQSLGDDLTATRAAPLLPVQLVQNVLELQVLPIVRGKLDAATVGEDLREFRRACRDLLEVALRHGHNPSLAGFIEG